MKKVNAEALAKEFPSRDPELPLGDKKPV